MPRKPDPELEERILKAALTLWKRGGEKALTLRGVAKTAGTNTPAVYRRFRNRKEILGALLRFYQDDLRAHFEAAESLEEVLEVFISYLMRHPHAYELLAGHAGELTPPSKSGRKRAIRETRPNFALVEQRLAKRLGGTPQDHTRLALALWALGQGAAALLITRAIPNGHQEEFRSSCRDAVKALIDHSASSFGKN